MGNVLEYCEFDDEFGQKPEGQARRGSAALTLLVHSRFHSLLSRPS